MASAKAFDSPPCVVNQSGEKRPLPGTGLPNMPQIRPGGFAGKFFHDAPSGRSTGAQTFKRPPGRLSNPMLIKAGFLRRLPHLIVSGITAVGLPITMLLRMAALGQSCKNYRDVQKCR